MDYGEFLVRLDFIAFNLRLALLIVTVPPIAENMAYFGKGIDLSLRYSMEEGALEALQSVQFEYLNLIAAYMLHALAGSQSMGKILHAFKNVRNMETFMENNAAPTDETQPILTRETMSYAISPSVSCVSLLANDNFVKGRASAAYERAIAVLLGFRVLGLGFRN